MIHLEPHELADKAVRLKLAGGDASDIKTGDAYIIEDWWDRLGSGSWMFAQGNPAALKYAIRSGVANLPLDNDVVYGKVGRYGHLVHISELGDIIGVEPCCDRDHDYDGNCDRHPDPEREAAI